MFKTRVYILAGFFALATAIVWGRLGQLQIVRGQYYRDVLTRRERPRIKLVAGARGSITDKNGRVLALDRPSYDLAVRVDQLRLLNSTYEQISKTRKQFKKFQQSEPPPAPAFVRQARKQLEHTYALITDDLRADPWIKHLADITTVEDSIIAKNMVSALDQIARGWKRTFNPVTFLENIQPEAWAQLQAAQEDSFRNPLLLSTKFRREFQDTNLSAETMGVQSFPGLVCLFSRKRHYPYGPLLSHVLGTLTTLSPAQMKSLKTFRTLIDHRAARQKIWLAQQSGLSNESARRLQGLLTIDPRKIHSVTDLMTRLQTLPPHARQAASQWGLQDPVRWAEQPLRWTLTEAEHLWLDSSATSSLPGRRSGQAALADLTIGETGLEYRYNERLRGKPGLLIVAKGNQPGSPTYLPKAAPVNGQTLKLTVDLNWQQACEEELAATNHPGALVIMDCHTGAILAMASFPDFDPNLFVPPRSDAAKKLQLQTLLKDPSKPLLNRCISDQYPLGSVMKTLISAVGLQKNLIGPTSTIECGGHFKEGNHTFQCDHQRPHYQTNVRHALRISCNIFFYRLGGRLGVEALGPWAKAIGFGRRTGVDLSNEATGIYPDHMWRQRAFPRPEQQWDRRWSRGKDYHLAIGQGLFACTPLQAACLMAVIANGGYEVTPHFASNHQLPQAPHPIGFSKKALSIVRAGMDEVVNIGTPGRKGTAYEAFHQHAEPLPVRVAGKTGTAEVGGQQNDHAWFAGFFPSKKPRYAFCMFVQNGGHGGEMAAPAVYRVLKKIYGTRSEPRERQR